MTVPFDLDVCFTGICAFVPNSDASDQYSLAVVMPGSDSAGQSIDEEPLYPHESYVGFYAAGSYTHSMRYSITNCRVGLVTTYATDVKPTPPKLPSGSPSHLLDLGTLIGRYAKPLDGLIKQSPPSPVMTQVLLGDGAITYVSDRYSWSIDKLDDGSAMQDVPLAHVVKLSFTALTSARLVGSDFDGTKNIDIDLSPNAAPGAPVVRITNLCTACSSKGQRDRDFKWYYELLTDEAKRGIAEELANRRIDLPIPRVTPMDVETVAAAELLSRSHAAGLLRVPMIGGQDCFPVSLPAMDFNG